MFGSPLKNMWNLHAFGARILFYLGRGRSETFFRFFTAAVGTSSPIESPHPGGRPRVQTPARQTPQRRPHRRHPRRPAVSRFAQGQGADDLAARRAHRPLGRPCQPDRARPFRAFNPRPETHRKRPPVAETASRRYHKPHRGRAPQTAPAKRRPPPTEYAAGGNADIRKETATWPTPPPSTAPSAAH